MRRYKADFIATSGRTPEVVRTLMMDADNLQHAIDQATDSLASDQIDITSIDIFVGEDKVSTVGAGPHSSRT